MKNYLTAQSKRVYAWGRNCLVLHEASSITSKCCFKKHFDYYAGKPYTVTSKGSTSCDLNTSQRQLFTGAKLFNNTRRSTMSTLKKLYSIYSQYKAHRARFLKLRSMYPKVSKNQLKRISRANSANVYIEMVSDLHYDNFVRVR